MRYKLRPPLVFKWTEASGNPIHEAAFTRDISTGGLFISCVECPPIRASLSLEIMLPPNSEIRSHGMRLDATVHVVRIASATEEKGFLGAGDLLPKKANTETTLDSRTHSLSRETLKSKSGSSERIYGQQQPRENDVLERELCRRSWPKLILVSPKVQIDCRSFVAG